MRGGERWGKRDGLTLTLIQHASRHVSHNCGQPAAKPPKVGQVVADGALQLGAVLVHKRGQEAGAQEPAVLMRSLCSRCATEEEEEEEEELEEGVSKLPAPRELVKPVEHHRGRFLCVHLPRRPGRRGHPIPGQ